MTFDAHHCCCQQIITCCCLQELVVCIVVQLVNPSFDPYNPNTAPAHTIVGLRTSSTPFLHNCMLNLVSPFHDDPVIRTHFWQHAMPLIPKRLQLYVERETKPYAFPTGSAVYIAILSKQPLTSINVSFNEWRKVCWLVRRAVFIAATCRYQEKAGRLVQHFFSVAL